MATKLFKFHWDCGRMGDLDGIFVADDARVKEVIGKEVYFGEVLGKHSEISGMLKKKDFRVLTDDPSFILQAEQYGLVPSGYNPFNYLEWC